MGDWEHKQRWYTVRTRITRAHDGLEVRGMVKDKGEMLYSSNLFRVHSGMNQSDRDKVVKEREKFGTISLTEWLDFECKDGWEVLKIWCIPGESEYQPTSYPTIFRRRKTE